MTGFTIGGADATNYTLDAADGHGQHHARPVSPSRGSTSGEQQGSMTRRRLPPSTRARRYSTRRVLAGDGVSPEHGHSDRASILQQGRGRGQDGNRGGTHRQAGRTPATMCWPPRRRPGPTLRRRTSRSLPASRRATRYSTAPPRPRWTRRAPSPRGRPRGRHGEFLDASAATGAFPSAADRKRTHGYDFGARRSPARTRPTIALTQPTTTASITPVPSLGGGSGGGTGPEEPWRSTGGSTC